MTGADGSILKRPDSEEPIEHDDMSHFFAASLADLDPFVGYHALNARAAGWEGVGRFGCIYLPSILLDVVGIAEEPLPDTLILWPTREELHDAYEDGVISWDQLVVARLVATHCSHEHRLKVAAVEAGGCP